MIQQQETHPNENSERECILVLNKTDKINVAILIIPVNGFPSKEGLY